VSIIDEITRRRRSRIARLGHSMGVPIPSRRRVSLVPFGRRDGKSFYIICEVKRASPSRGVFAPGTDAVEKARHYASQGIRTLSVLTEEEHFSGSLEDIIRIKTAFPDLCVMRKDFIIDEEDLSVSFRAGADAVLLIACMHPAERLCRLHAQAVKMGLEVLFEVHDEADLQKARAVKPAITGFNSRNLASFRIDPLVPLALRGKVDWNTDAVYESGITAPEHAAVALSAGFSGMLVGEGAMRSPDLIDRIGAMQGKKWNDFWHRLYGKGKGQRPLVKVCGMTKENDARLAAELGADILGFIFAPSPRRADSSLLERLADLGVPKVGVVVQEERDDVLGESVQCLLDDGLLDAVQFHGDELPEACFRMAFPYYKAVRLGTLRDVELIGRYWCPRVLIDAFVPGKPGGTGQSISVTLIEAVRERHPLWLAGGIGTDNVGEIIRAFRPELIDASSLLEAKPGVKDEKNMRDFFRAIEKSEIVY